MSTRQRMESRLNRINDWAVRLLLACLLSVVIGVWVTDWRWVVNAVIVGVPTIWWLVFTHRHRNELLNAACSRCENDHESEEGA